MPDETDQHNAQDGREAFLAAIGHEMRTPLGAILGMAEVALSSDSPAEIRDCLLRIQRNGTSLLGLINDLLDVAKIERGEFDLDERTYDVGALVDDVLDTLIGRAQQKRLQLTGRVDAAVPPWLRGDPQRLRQILLNLVGNAIKFTARGHVAVLATAVADQLVITVEDTGMGMDADDQTHVFDKFWRSANARGHGGTGLGLSITRAIVENMRGTVAVRSALGHGSTFEVRLPLQPEAVVVDSQRPRVMVVVRDAAMRREIQRALHRTGVPLGIFHSAGNALDQNALLAGTPGVLIADADDPNLPGLAAEVHHARGGVLGIVSEHAGPLQPCLDATLHAPLQMRTLCVRVDELMVKRSARMSMYLPQRNAPQSTATARVLVVDDTADSARVTGHILRKAGYAVDIAEDGVRAVERVQQHDYAVVIMDVEMPELDGMGATRRIRSEERTRGWPHLPILGLSAHATDSVRTACLALGMDDFSAKPIDKHRLLEWTAQWAETRPLVLVVDDADDVRMALRRFLETDGRYRVMQATDGLAALALLEQRLPALLVLDQEMPEMDGLALLEAIRAQTQTAALPVLMLSGRQDLAFAQRAAALGCVARLQKPVGRREFLAEVSSAIFGAAEVLDGPG